VGAPQHDALLVLLVLLVLLLVLLVLLVLVLLVLLAIDTAACLLLLHRRACQVPDRLKALRPCPGQRAGAYDNGLFYRLVIYH
jgi:hypothetical protein